MSVVVVVVFAVRVPAAWPLFVLVRKLITSPGYAARRPDLTKRANRGLNRHTTLTDVLVKRVAGPPLLSSLLLYKHPGPQDITCSPSHSMTRFGLYSHVGHGDW